MREGSQGDLLREGHLNCGHEGEYNTGENLRVGQERATGGSVPMFPHHRKKKTCGTPKLSQTKSQDGMEGGYNPCLCVL